MNQHDHELREINQNYRVFDHFVLNDALLANLEKVKQRVPVYLFSDGALHESPEVASCLASAITKIFTASELKTPKTSSSAYVELAKRIKCGPNEILFVDDKADNIRAAQLAGLEAIRFVSNENVLPTLHNLTKG